MAGIAVPRQRHIHKKLLFVTIAVAALTLVGSVSYIFTGISATGTSSQPPQQPAVVAPSPTPTPRVTPTPTPVQYPEITDLTAVWEEIPFSEVPRNESRGLEEWRGTVFDGQSPQVMSTGDERTMFVRGIISPEMIDGHRIDTAWLAAARDGDIIYASIATIEHQPDVQHVVGCCYLFDLLSVDGGESWYQMDPPLKQAEVVRVERDGDAVRVYTGAAPGRWYRAELQLSELP